jgi:hypothetical protein
MGSFVLSISQCRGILGSRNDLGDDEVRKVRDALYAVAQVTVAALLAQEGGGDSGTVPQSHRGDLAVRDAAPRSGVVEQALKVVGPPPRELPASPAPSGPPAPQHGRRRGAVGIVAAPAPAQVTHGTRRTSKPAASSRRPRKGVRPIPTASTVTSPQGSDTP